MNIGWDKLYQWELAFGEMRTFQNSFACSVKYFNQKSTPITVINVDHIIWVSNNFHSIHDLMWSTLNGNQHYMSVWSFNVDWRNVKHPISNTLKVFEILKIWVETIRFQKYPLENSFESTSISKVAISSFLRFGDIHTSLKRWTPASYWC